MLQANPKLKATAVRDIVCAKARVADEKGDALLVSDRGASPAKPSLEFGHGLLDATGSVKEALERRSAS
jgi:hypothetical protein